MSKLFNLLILFLFLTACSSEDKIYCKPEQRNADVCIALYDPVCGYPGKQTYSNSCAACSNKNIEYYTKGEC